MQAIIATLGYVFSPGGDEVLMVRRDIRPDDLHYGKYNGLGGKLEPDEDAVSGLRREIHEEAGIDCDLVELAGTISWPGFGRNGENWFGFLFRVPHWSGTPLAGNDEGSLHWVPIADLLAGRIPMWESDRHFLPLVFAAAPTVFHGIMPFKDGEAVSWSFTS
ncbi:NUDIX hydrolase [Actinoplanes solisilvae]|uniref:NUDIX hydrolase n=1 Tax=Actinoplanes solisilvae TaxID=2486853 RepID=UPI001F0CD7C9|nr:8-oxo-dGTP diphosphatase [Actinoplanes solisilvae]